MDIGHKIKELRTQKHLTQEELADRCELTKGFISQLERDHTSPSIATLMDILQCLGTDLPSFFNNNDTDDEQIVFHQSDYFVKKDDELHNQVEWIIPNAQKNQMEPILMTLYPHKKSHVQTSYTGEEFGYVLKGNITIVRGGKKYKVKAHETFYMDGAKSHYLYNHGNSPAKILWITTPPIF